MLYSSARKRALSGWFKKNHQREFHSPLRLHKYLFFYEGLSKLDGARTEFHSLKGYVNGPVFGDVYGDYTYNFIGFALDAESNFTDRSQLIDEERAKIAGFLVSIMSEEELSNLTHHFNIWKIKEDRINSGEKHVPLSEHDFNSDDLRLIKSLKEMYPIEYIDSVCIIPVNDTYYVINKSELQQLGEDQKIALYGLSDNNSLQNPVYISIAEDGVVLVD